MEYGKGCSFRSYIKGLIDELWKQGPSFDAKRPFGFSGWQHEVYSEMIENHLLVAYDKDGLIQEFDKGRADIAIRYCIDHIFREADIERKKNEELKDQLQTMIEYAIDLAKEFDDDPNRKSVIKEIAEDVKKAEELIK